VNQSTRVNMVSRCSLVSTADPRLRRARPRLARLQPPLAAEQIDVGVRRIARTAGGGAALFASMKR
jgi:hypothetical protein